MQEVHTELDVVLAVDVVGRIGDLPAALVRKCGAVQEVRRTEGEEVGDDHARRRTQRIGVAAARCHQVAGLVRRRGLAVLKLEVATILVPHFVAQMVVDRRLQPGNQERHAHIVVAEAADAVVGGACGLNAGRRGPAQAVELKRSMVARVDLPVDLGEEDCLGARARNRAEHRVESGDAVDVVVRGSGIGREIEIRLQCAGRRIDRARRCPASAVAASCQPARPYPEG